MRTKIDRLDRRQLLRLGLTSAVGGAFALEQLAGVPLIGSSLDYALRSFRPNVNTYDAFAMMGDALRGGPALLGVHRAMAQSSTAVQSPWTLVQIKMCNHVWTPLICRLGEISAGVVTTGGDVPLASSVATTSKSTLQTLGIDKISTVPRLKNLRLNNWFGNMLYNGTTDGQSPGGANLAGLNASDVQPLDSNVALQVFLQVGQIDATVNHALRGCKLRSDLGDLTLFAGQQGLITSPLGISCFMMGNNYDRAEGAIPLNAVLDGEASETAVVTSRRVGDYVSQIGQYAGQSYVDRSACEQSTLCQIDRLVASDLTLRESLLKSITEFQTGLLNLQSTQALEGFQRQMDPTQGAIQANDAVTGKKGGPYSEFLAQCKYVAASLDLPGQPVRNYSLFLNATDLDGNPIDVANDGGGGNAAVQSLTYVEAYRQLAMGLNVLAKKISGGAKMIVVLSSEGGRAANMGDAKTGFAMVLGPTGAGQLTDALFSNMAAINGTSNAVLQDPGQPGAAVPWDTGGLMTQAGVALPNVAANAGDIQMGVVEFLEEQMGISARTNLSSADGQYVKLARQTA